MHSLVTHGPHENGGARVAMSCTSRTSDPHDSTGTATTATASMTRSDHSTDQCTSNPVGLGVLSLRGELEQTPAELRDLDLSGGDAQGGEDPAKSAGGADAGTVDSDDDGEEQGQ